MARPWVNGYTLKYNGVRTPLSIHAMERCQVLEVAGQSLNRPGRARRGRVEGVAGRSGPVIYPAGASPAGKGGGRGRAGSWPVIYPAGASPAGKKSRGDAAEISRHALASGFRYPPSET